MGRNLDCFLAGFITFRGEENFISHEIVKKPTSIIVVISGPSGVGKKVVITELLKMEPSLLLSVSATSRSPRKGEQEGVDYFFLSEEEFKERIDQGDFLEWACVHGNYYGTLLENFRIAKKLNSHLILEIDIQGGASIKQKFSKECLLIFLLPPSFCELEKRIRMRGTESEEQIQKRLATAKLELTHVREYDYRVINFEPKQTANDIWVLIKGRSLDE
jgi:guanylate kinase